MNRVPLGLSLWLRRSRARRFPLNCAFAALVALALFIHPGRSADAAGASGDAAIHIVLAGDSTVTDTAGWGRAFAQMLRPGIRCTNLSRGGTSTKSFRDLGLWQQVLALKPTHVMIQFGHNDMPNKGAHRATDAGTTYRENLIRYVDEARAAGAQPILVTSLARRNFKDGQLVDLLADYAAAMRAVAVEKNVPLVDLHARSIAAIKHLGPAASAELGPIKDGKRDYTHLNEGGAKWTAQLIAGELRTLQLPLAGFLK